MFTAAFEQARVHETGRIGGKSIITGGLRLPFRITVPYATHVDRDGNPERFRPDFELAGRIAAHLNGTLEMPDPESHDGVSLVWHVVGKK